jgi:hypothetical protein
VRTTISLLIALFVLAAVPAAAQDQTPRCFGAKARDPRNPCANPRFHWRVLPKPRDALLEPSAPCKPVRGSKKDKPYRCVFGEPEDEAQETVALVGDSHAAHWRSALWTVMMRRHWHAVSITRTGCPYTKTPPRMREPARSRCIRWQRDVERWFEEHPDVHTVFVSEHRGPAGRYAPGVESRGYHRAWDDLPKSVTRIIVIRDTPRSTKGTQACVARAMRRHERADRICGVARSYALRRDPAAVAAARSTSDRVALIDLTHFMCDRTLCFPVVGGALVFKDLDHITAVFGATLGPYLLRRVEAILRD